MARIGGFQFSDFVLLGVVGVGGYLVWRVLKPITDVEGAISGAVGGGIGAVSDAASGVADAIQRGLSGQNTTAGFYTPANALRDLFNSVFGSTPAPGGAQGASPIRSPTSNPVMNTIQAGLRLPFQLLTAPGAYVANLLRTPTPTAIPSYNIANTALGRAIPVRASPFSPINYTPTTGNVAPVIRRPANISTPVRTNIVNARNIRPALIRRY